MIAATFGVGACATNMDVRAQLIGGVEAAGEHG